MTRLRAKLTILAACTVLCSNFSAPLAGAAQQAETYQEALQKAGDDGVIAYCYGADWNRSSVRMLKSFWANPALLEAAGDAVMVSVPFYQDPPTAEELEGNVLSPAAIQSGMPNPPFGVCPTVLMFDKNGRLYASLVGADYLGDETGALGIQNIREKLAAHRKQMILMNKVKTLPAGSERSKLLIEASELGIAVPPTAAALLAEAKDEASKDLKERFDYSALAFMYEQLETTDGFLKEDFIEDVGVIKKAVLSIANDEKYRAMDRQAAYNLYLGAMRRDGTAGSRMRNPIKQNIRIGEDTLYGKAMVKLVEAWGDMKHDRRTAAEKKALRDRKKKRDQDDRAQDRAQGNISID